MLDMGNPRVKFTLSHQTGISKPPHETTNGT